MSNQHKKNQAMAVVEDVVGCKWTLRVLDALRKGVRRPGELKKSIPGISEKVLNERLKKLMRFELVCRRVYPVTPPRVEYSLTAKGKKIFRVFQALDRFAAS